MVTKSKIVIESLTLFGISLITTQVSKIRKTCKLNLVVILPEKTIEICVKVMSIGISDKDADGYSKCRVVFRHLKNSQIATLTEIVEYFADKPELIPELITANFV